MHILKLTILTAVLPTFVWSQAVSPPDVLSSAIAELQSGIICPPEPLGAVPAPGTVAGVTHVIDGEPPFVSTSNIVPAVIGIGFGVKSSAVDSAGIADVTMTITHPPMGADQVESQSFSTTIRGQDPSLTFYQFDFDYELLPGIWHMEAMKGGEMLYTTTFEVVPPQMVPELAAVCGYTQFLS